MDTETEPIDARASNAAKCPAVHADFSAPLEAGSHWRLANEYRAMSPALFNTMAQGYWMFTDHERVRDMYRNPDVFSSESITPWDPDPVYRFVPTQIDAPDHITYRQILNPWFSPGAVDRAEPMAREICRRLVEEVVPTGGCDFVTGFALRYPTEVFLTMIGCPASDADLLRAVGGGLLPRLRRRRRRRRADGRRAQRDPRVLGERARRAPRRTRTSPGRPRVEPHACDVRLTTLDRRRDARHVDRVGARRPRHHPRPVGLPVQVPRRAS